jgi:hypothetical protein
MFLPNITPHNADRFSIFCPTHASQLPSFYSPSLVDLLLLINAVLSGPAVDQEQKAADDGQDLEEVILGEILVWMRFVKLQNVSVSPSPTNAEAPGLQSRSC